jgi:hypothetical protein
MGSLGAAHVCTDDSMVHSMIRNETTLREPQHKPDVLVDIFLRENN